MQEYEGMVQINNLTKNKRTDGRGPIFKVVNFEWERRDRYRVSVEGAGTEVGTMALRMAGLLDCYLKNLKISVHK